MKRLRSESPVVPPTVARGGSAARRPLNEVNATNNTTATTQRKPPLAMSRGAPASSQRANANFSGGVPPRVGTGAKATTAAKKPPAGAAPQRKQPLPAGPSKEQLWGLRVSEVAADLARGTAAARQSEDVVAAYQDAVEALLTSQAGIEAEAAAHREEEATKEQDALVDLDKQVLLMQQSAADAHAERGFLGDTISDISREKEDVDERIVVAKGSAAEYDEEMAAVLAEAEQEQAELDTLQGTVDLMKDATYGLSADAAALIKEDDRLLKRMQECHDAAIATEMDRRRKFSLYEELKGTIRVYCRVKGSSSDAAGGPSARYSYPNTEEEGGEGRSVTVTQRRDNATSTGTRESRTTFSYDRVYNPDNGQQPIFEDVGPLVHSAVDGYRVCIFAYGQTGSGKTYTMEGDVSCEVKRGIIPRSIDVVFDRVAALASDGWKYTVKCYFVEIYNDNIRDLLERSEAYHRAFLDGKSSSSTHDIQHKGKVDTVVTGITEKVVQQPSEVYHLLQLASRNRSVAKTQMNDRSSRSHCVFTMRIEGHNEKLNQRSLGNLCLVDLAGSERVSESGVQGQQLKEAVNINKSLTFLGDCICAMGSGAVVPWRNCKLTYLLQNYLGGDGAKMLMLVTASDKEEHTAETVNSLRFATKVNQTHIGSAKRRVS